jgi:hypothetical protein
MELEPFSPKHKHQQNLAHEPIHTYIYDDYSKSELETLFDKIKFFSDTELGLTMEDMVLEHKTLSAIFMPVCTYDDKDSKSQNEEFVSSIEGIVYPWFGVNYRVDRVQYSMESSARDKVDHSRESVMHAQKLANFFVDEARLSGNEFKYVKEEHTYLDMIYNNDLFKFEVPLIQSDDENTIRTQLYLF